MPTSTKFFHPSKQRKRKKKSSTKPKTLYKTDAYSRWRTRVFRRDRYTCRECGAADCYLEAHHILRKADFPDLMFETNNGISLCLKCHRMVTGSEYMYADHFMRLLKRHPHPQVPKINSVS